jgi:hypothetical protein
VRLLHGAIVLAACILVARNAIADDDIAYQSHYDTARELVRANDLRGAIREFEAAFSASPKPEAVFNTGVLYRNLALSGGSAEDAQRAIDHFQTYATRWHALHGTDPNDAKTIDSYVAELREHFHLQAPTSSASPSATESSPSPATTPPTRPQSSATVPPPSTPSPQPATPPPSVAPTPTPPAATVQTPTSTISVVSPEPARPIEGRHSRARLLASSVALGVGGIAVATGAVLLGIGTRDGTGSDFSTLDSFNAHVTAFEDAGIVLLAVGGAAIVGGVIALALPSKAKPSGHAARRVTTAKEHF